MTTPFEKLKKANDDYHEAFNGILTDDILPVEKKVEFAKFGNIVFCAMTNANELIRNYYE